MKTLYLFPNQFKKIGWVILIFAILSGILWIAVDFEPDFFKTKVLAFVSGGIFNDTKYFTILENNIFDEILGIMIIVGSLLIIFSKTKKEDEFISKIRYESLVWATYLNYGILILAFLFVYDIPFFWVLIFNMFTILFFSIIRFYWVIYRTKKSMGNEK